MSIESQSGMPATVKAIVVALFISLVATLIAAYLEGQEFEGMGFGDPLISGTNFIWALVVVWMMWDLFRKRNIELSLLFVGIVIIAFTIWDFIDFGVSLSLLFYVVEFLMFAVSYALIKTEQSKLWLSSSKT